MIIPPNYYSSSAYLLLDSYPCSQGMHEHRAEQYDALEQDLHPTPSPHPHRSPSLSPVSRR